MTRYKDAKQSAGSLGQAANRGQPTQQSDNKVPRRTHPGQAPSCHSEPRVRGVFVFTSGVPGRKRGLFARAPHILYRNKQDSCISAS